MKFLVYIFIFSAVNSRGCRSYTLRLPTQSFSKKLVVLMNMQSYVVGENEACRIYFSTLLIVGTLIQTYSVSTTVCLTSCSNTYHPSSCNTLHWSAHNVITTSLLVWMFIHPWVPLYNKNWTSKVVICRICPRHNSTTFRSSTFDIRREK